MATRTLSEAEAALKSGGLTGKTLDMALTSLRNSYGNTNVSTPPQDNRVRNLQLNSGDPASSLTQSGGASAGVAQAADPYTIFNQQITQMLTRAQTMGTKRFQEQGLNAQQAQNDRISAGPPSDLIGAAPGLQESVRSNSVQALNPTIDQARNAQQTFGEQINSYKGALDSARQLVSSQQAQADKQRDDARAVIKDALTMGGADSLNQLAPEELKQLEKLAGYPAGYVTGLSQTIKERELQLKQETSGQMSPTQIANEVDRIAGQFDSEPIVKAFNTTQEGFQTIKSIGVNTSSPADDIAFIYAFAKIMDPNSVVREGEYNTVQRYAQTWADNFGFKAQRVFSNTNFLTADAKQKMLNALSQKVTAISNQYTNLRSEYQRQMDDARAGTPRTLTDYSVPGTSNSTGSGGGLYDF